MALFTFKEFESEREKVCPNATNLIRDLGARDIKTLSAQELQSLTDATTLWVPGGNHEWRHDESIVEARYLAHELTKFPRATGEPECTHGMGSADLAINYGLKADDDPVLVGFVMYNHDRLENNRGIVTAEDIFEVAWQKDKQLKKVGIKLLNGITDTYGLHGTARLAEQVLRANTEKSGLLGRCRILEKHNASLHDFHNLSQSIIPFKDAGRYMSYIKLRVEVMNAIKARGCKPLLEMYNELAQHNLNLAKQIADRKEPARPCAGTASQPQIQKWPQTYLSSPFPAQAC